MWMLRRIMPISILLVSHGNVTSWIRDASLCIILFVQIALCNESRVDWERTTTYVILTSPCIRLRWRGGAHKQVWLDALRPILLIYPGAAGNVASLPPHVALNHANPRIRSSNRSHSVKYAMTHPSLPCCLSGLYRCWGLLSLILLSLSFCAVIFVWRDNLLVSPLETPSDLLWASLYTTALPIGLFVSVAYVLFDFMQKHRNAT